MRHFEERPSTINITPERAAEVIDALKATLHDLQNSTDSPDVQKLRLSLLASIAELESLRLC